MPTTPGDVPTRGTINVLTGGPMNGDSNRARKSYARFMESLAIGGDRAIREAPQLRFGPGDMEGILFPYNDTLVIRATITNYEGTRVLVDSRSSINVLFQEDFSQIRLEDAQLEDVMMPLFGFTGHVVHPVGHVSLPLTLGKWLSQRTDMTPFLIVDAPYAYNVILGRPFLSAFMMVAFPYH